MSSRFAVPAVCIAFALIAAPAHASHWLTNTEDNTPVCTATGPQDLSVAISDGEGGIIVAWQDLRVELYHHIYAQRISANGDPMWAPDGVLLGTFASNQQIPEIVSDGAGGAIVVWVDQRADIGDLYAQRISAAGAVMWNANGVPLVVAGSVQTLQKGIADGAGGAIFTWTDARPAGTFSHIYAQRINASGLVQWAANGVAVCTATNSQSRSTLATDRQQGAVIAWEDYRSDTFGDVYAQRVRADGTIAWTLNGVPVASLAWAQKSPVVSYAQGTGSYVAWSDARGGGGTEAQIYIQRLFSTGGPAYAVNGVQVSDNVGGDDFRPQIADGSSAISPSGVTVWLLWEHQTDLGAKELVLSDWYFSNIMTFDKQLDFGNGDKLNPHLTTNEVEHGALISWTSDSFYGPGASNVFLDKFYANTFLFGGGVPACVAEGAQSSAHVVSDFQGGAVLAWDDTRHGSGHTDVRAQRIQFTAEPGYASPDITSIVDVPEDQGRRVLVSWTPSTYDAFDVDLDSKHYGVWRRDPNVGSLANPNPSSSAAQRDSRRALAVAAGSSPELVERLTASGWELEGTVPSVGLPSYAFSASTYADSTSQGNPQTEFMVVFETSAGNWYSAEGSGHSVDNYQPNAPIQLAGSTAGLHAQLTWQQPNASPDVVAYRVYRSNAPGVAVVPANRIATVEDLNHLDKTTGGATFHYVVTALDDAEQEGPPSNEVIAPTGVTDVATALPAMLSLSAASRSASGRTLHFRFGLPADAQVSLALYDVSGRQVHEVAPQKFTAGWHEHHLDAADAQLASGAYFLRLRAGGESRVLKFAVLR